MFYYITEKKVRLGLRVYSNGSRLEKKVESPNAGKEE
jgi:hypothetical protein